MIVSESVMSVGDCLRDIDAKDLITSDFVLISGDVISNLDLAAVIGKNRNVRHHFKFLTLIETF